MARQIWKNWCCLCGSHTKSNVDILIKKEDNCCTQDIILRFFSLNVQNNHIPKKICRDCSNFLKTLSNFEKQVKNVEIMYFELNCQEKLEKEIDLNNFRIKFGLSEIHDFEYKKDDISKHCKVETDELSNVCETVLDDNEWIRSNKDYHNCSPKLKMKEGSSIVFMTAKRELLLNETNKILHLETIQCEACPKVFAQISRYLLHLKKKHNIIKEPPPKIQNNFKDKIICKLCGKSCGNRGAYVSHMQKKHENAKIEEPKLYECRICSKTFTQKMTLSKHEEIHLPKEQRNLFPCTQCCKKFLNEYLLEAHVRIVHLKERPFVCEVCGKGTTSKRSLDDHKLVHMEATHKCEICSQLFKNVQRLKVHMKTHENFNVPCLICNSRLKNNQSLKEHMLIHTDIKNFKCPLCQNAFRCRRNLRAHMLTHTGMKPYHCSFCEVSYANRSNCKKHEKHAHPTEFAEMEAKGLKVHSKNVPKFHELKQMMEQMKQEKELQM